MLCKFIYFILLNSNTRGRRCHSSLINMIFQKHTYLLVALEVIFPVTSNRVVTSVPKKKILSTSKIMAMNQISYLQGVEW